MTGPVSQNRPNTVCEEGYCYNSARVSPLVTESTNCASGPQEVGFKNTYEFKKNPLLQLTLPEFLWMSTYFERTPERPKINVEDRHEEREIAESQ